MHNYENCLHYGSEFENREEREEFDEKPFFLHPQIRHRLRRHFPRRRYPFGGW